MNLDVFNDSMNDGDNIEIYNLDLSSSRWNIVNLGNGTYKLMSNCSERTKAMTVQNASIYSGANVYQYSSNGAEAWYFKVAADCAFICPSYQQEQSEWCWNACARMVASYRYSVTMSQSDMASDIFWPAGAQNWGASLSQTANALWKYTNKTINTSYLDSTTAVTFSWIQQKIQSTRSPIIVGVHYSIPNYDHMIVIYGYNSSSNMVLDVDPEYGIHTYDDVTIFNYPGEVNTNGSVFYS